jgi:hypothetical protein
MRKEKGVKEEVLGLRKRMSQFLSNGNHTTINRNIKIAALSRETHLESMVGDAH